MEQHPSHLADRLAALRVAAQRSRACARRSLRRVLEAMLLALLVRLLRRLERQVRALPPLPDLPHPTTARRATARHTSVHPDSAEPGFHLPRWYRRNPNGALRRARRLAAWIGHVCRGLPGLGLRPIPGPRPRRHPTRLARSPPLAAMPGRARAPTPLP
jgi:hypothetical protein